MSPLIIEPQKKLQKAQLAHRLSDQLAHRPGPLELIEKGILETDNLQVQNAIRNGQVHYDKVDSIYAMNPGMSPDLITLCNRIFSIGFQFFGSG